MFGNVEITKCSCVQRSGGRCCHIAALLFLIKDVALGTEPKMRKFVSVTSKLQSWGQGNLLKYFVVVILSDVYEIPQRYFQ